MHHASVHHAAGKQGHAGGGNAYLQWRDPVIGPHPRGGTRAGTKPARAEASWPDLLLSKSLELGSVSRMKASSVGARQGGAQRAKVSKMTGQREAGSMQGISRRHSNDSGKDGVRRVSKWHMAVWRQGGGFMRSRQAPLT